MGNIADLIEDYILRKLSEEHNSKVELKRSDIADAISCAPSQISYVLNTRFTQEKGFVVESRRGLGGFIRIAKVPLQDFIYQDLLDNVNEKNTLDDVEAMITHMYRHQLLRKREMAILMQTVNNIFVTMKPKERTDLIKSLIITLANFHDL